MPKARLRLSGYNLSRNREVDIIACSIVGRLVHIEANILKPSLGCPVKGSVNHWFAFSDKQKKFNEGMTRQIHQVLDAKVIKSIKEDMFFRKIS